MELQVPDVVLHGVYTVVLGWLLHLSCKCLTLFLFHMMSTEVIKIVYLDEDFFKNREM
jgi:hypothetical protein